MLGLWNKSPRCRLSSGLNSPWLLSHVTYVDPACQVYNRPVFECTFPPPKGTLLLHALPHTALGREQRLDVRLGDVNPWGQASPFGEAACEVGGKVTHLMLLKVHMI